MGDGIGKEHGEDQRHRGQRLLAAGKQREDLHLLARRLGEDFKARFERIFEFDEFQLAVPPPKSVV